MDIFADRAIDFYKRQISFYGKLYKKDKLGKAIWKNYLDWSKKRLIDWKKLKSNLTDK